MSILIDLLDQYIANRKALNMSPTTLKGNASHISIIARWLREKYGVPGRKN